MPPSRAWRSITPERRARVRVELPAPIIAKFHARLTALAQKVLPQSLLGKVVHYALGQWPKLTTFLEHGEVPLDNNRCENAIRSFVLGRKGWLFRRIFEALLFWNVKTQLNGPTNRPATLTNRSTTPS